MLAVGGADEPIPDRRAEPISSVSSREDHAVHAALIEICSTEARCAMSAHRCQGDHFALKIRELHRVRDHLSQSRMRLAGFADQLLSFGHAGGAEARQVVAQGRSAGAVAAVSNALISCPGASAAASSAEK